MRIARRAADNTTVKKFRNLVHMPNRTQSPAPLLRRSLFPSSRRLFPPVICLVGNYQHLIWAQMLAALHEH